MMQLSLLMLTLFSESRWWRPFYVWAAAAVTLLALTWLPPLSLGIIVGAIAILETIDPIATGYASKRSGEVRKDLKAEH